MEAFSLLNYWRSGGDGGGRGCAVEQDSSSTPTIVTAAVSPCFSDGEDGPYFDLEFTLPEDETDAEEDESTPKRSENDDTTTRRTEDIGDETEDGSRAEEGSENENGGDPKFTAESSSILLNVSEETSYSAFPVSLLKSATKIRVLLLKFKRSKSEKSENQENQCTKTSGKFFAVKFKVEEVKAPLSSLFNRDNHSKEKQGKGMKNNEENSDLSAVSVSDDKKLIQKYLKMVKPLYIRVSKRYVEKLKFPGGQLSFSGSKGGGAAASPPRVAVEEEGPGAAEAERVKSRIAPPQVNGGLVQASGPKVVQKQLGKSRSASAAVAASPPDRRDDSLLQVQDGIQDAILHCKRSFQRL